MNPVDWYFARGNKQMGPVSAAELKRLATAGELRPEDLVWREGLTEWALARSVRGLFEDEAKPAAGEETPSKPVVALPQGAEPDQPAASFAAARRQPRARHLVDLLLNSLRVHFNARFVEATARLFRDCGLYGLLAALMLVAAFMLIMAVKTNTLANLLSGAILLLTLAALQYLAGKFCDVLERLNLAKTGSLASSVVPDSLAILSVVAGLAALLGSVATATELSIYAAILPGIGGFIVCAYVAFVALNPSTVGTSIGGDESSASAEAVGVLRFLLKVLLRSTPVALGVGVIAGVLTLGYGCYQLLSGAEGLLAGQSSAASCTHHSDRFRSATTGGVSGFPGRLSRARPLPCNLEPAGEARRASEKP